MEVRQAPHALDLLDQQHEPPVFSRRAGARRRAFLCPQGSIFVTPSDSFRRIIGYSYRSMLARANKIAAARIVEHRQKQQRLLDATTALAWCVLVSLIFVSINIVVC